MSRSVVYTLHLWPPLGHAAHYTGTTPERRLAQRLTDHALGRGARLTQVQAERGGSWVLAQTQPGGRATERRLKQHGATRRCEVCKAAGAYQSGELTAPEALARAGWDRSNEVQRSLLLDIFGIPKPPGMPSADAPRRRREPPAVTPGARRTAAPDPSPASGTAAGLALAGAARPAPGPELDPVVDALIASWRSPEPDAQPDRRTRNGGKRMNRFLVETSYLPEDGPMLHRL